MRTVFRLIAILCLAVQVFAAADTQGRAKFTFTGVPLDGNTITYRGVTKTWKTVLTAPSTQILIGGTATASANNFVAAVSTYPFDSNSAVVQSTSGTVVTIIADANLTVTASVTGTWGSVAVTTTTLTQRGIGLPFATEPTTTRTNDANDLILAFNYANTTFSANVAALANYVNTSLAQTISGAKTYTGANILSNANLFITGGIVSNMTLTNIQSSSVTNFFAQGRAAFLNKVAISNTQPNLRFYKTDGAADEKSVAMSLGAGVFNIYMESDDLATANALVSFTRTGATPTAAIFSVPITGSQFVNGLINGSMSTNQPMIHAIAAMIQNPMFYGTVALSNAAPILMMQETDAGSNLKKFQWRSEAGVLTLYMADDTGNVASNQRVWAVERPGLSQFTADSKLHIFSPVQFDSSVLFSSADVDHGGTVSANGGFLSGPTATASTMPGGQDNGLYILDGAAPFADPLTGSTIWSEGGELKYRTSGASEGSGQGNHIQNRTGSTYGAGTDYTLTGSTAFVDFGTTDPKVTLPTAGTYFIWADVAITEDLSNANDEIRAKLRNETAATDLSGADVSISYLPAGKLGMLKLTGTVTANASDVIAVWAFNNSGARGTVNSARTRIGYVRLY